MISQGRDSWDISFAISKGIRDLRPTDDWYSSEPVEAMPIGESFETAHGTCTKVAQNLEHDFNFDYNSIWIVFEVQGRFFKLTGWKSSYGNSHWNDALVEVHAKEETRVFYE